ncbi:MAG: hypothetical protein H0T79_20630 [Deltaproteobacteria bacterium]|nr:hypothetical protein [Deltaproteobacteria bacterium]
MKLTSFVYGVILVVGLLVLGTPRTAMAGKPKIAFIKIEGDSGTAVRDALAAAVKSDMAVVGFKEVNRTATKLGVADDASDKDFGKLADELGAEVVVAGKLEDEKTLKIKLYVKGKKSKKFSVNFGNPKSDKFKKIMSETLLNKIAAINKSGDDDEVKPKKKPKDEETEEEDVEAKPKKVAKKKPGAEDEEEDPLSTKKSKVADEEEGENDEKPRKKKRSARRDDEELEEDGELTVRATAPAHAANRVAVRLDAGVSAANRSLDFNTRVYEQKPADYQNPIVPGARFSFEAYPFAFVDPKGRAAGLGMWGDYDKTISLQLASTASDGTVVRAKAIQQHYSFGGGYRFAFTRSDLSPTFTIGLNYGRRTFKADASTLGGVMLDLPDVDYKMYQPLAALRIPIAKQFALVAGGRGMLITDAGSITKADQYGQAKVFGIEASGGFDIVFSNRFAVRIIGEFSQVGFTFTKGSGDKANNRDNDATTKDVFGAADRSVGATATLGVLY